MVAHVAPPGLENTGHAGQPAKMLRLPGKIEKRRRGSAEGCGAHRLLVGTGDLPALLGQRERNQEIVRGEQQLSLSLDPSSGSLVPALGAGAVTAGVVYALS